ncbi:membrane protein of unknown function [Nitrospira japonica]|uniref:Uncharacterized protein n=1 Tax=Nitrospira japonica TaxID=1325564 RepID=A0A1W1I8I8_9BACT|nr:membrane protein of unknown function [Nitrospira japonica]
MKGDRHDMDRSGDRRAVSLRLPADPPVHDRHRSGAIVALSLYLLLIGVMAWVWAVTPAFALVSATGYVRVATDSSKLLYLGANRAALLSTVAQAAAVTSPASVAVRLVTGPIGWAALGVSVGLALYQMHYSDTELQAVKQAAAPSNLQTGTGLVLPNGAALETAQSCLYPSCTAGQAQIVTVAIPGKTQATCGLNVQPVAFPLAWFSNLGEAWNSGRNSCVQTFRYVYDGASSNNLVRSGVGVATPQQIQDYVAALPASDPKSIESNTTPLGQGATATPAATTTSTAVSPTEIPTTVKPVGQVAPTDAVVDPNAPKPAGTQTVPATQNTTSTTTTTTNPDGSTTEATQESASVSCSGADHDARSFGSILQAHITTWQGSGLLSALAILQTLTWPDALPIITFTSATWGTHQVDFNQWAAVFTVLRTLTIAGAGFAAYRIIFVGGA